MISQERKRLAGVHLLKENFFWRLMEALGIQSPLSVTAFWFFVGSIRNSIISFCYCILILCNMLMSLSKSDGGDFQIVWKHWLRFLIFLWDKHCNNEIIHLRHKIHRMRRDRDRDRSSFLWFLNSVKLCLTTEWIFSSKWKIVFVSCKYCNLLEWGYGFKRALK